MPKTGIRPYETKTKGLRWLVYYHRNGKQVLRRGFRTSRQAEQWRAQALTSIESPSDTTLTVGEWVTEWLGRHKSRIRSSTYCQYEGSLRNWIMPHLGLVRLTALSHRDIEIMHDKAIQAGRTPATVRRNHAPLRMSLQDAVRDGIIPSNPAILVRLPPEDRAEIEPFTIQEAVTFLTANEGHELYPVYHLALHSGLRLGEILALKVGRDIDLFRGIVQVRETRRNGVTGPPKSRESARRVVIPPKAVEVLGRAIANKAYGEVAFPHRTDYVSSSITGACRRAGVKRIRFHDLRHTHATALIAAGQNIRAVSARLGHSTPSFTLQVYGHVMPGQDENLAKAAESLFETDSSKMLSRDDRGAVKKGV